MPTQNRGLTSISAPDWKSIDLVYPKHHLARLAERERLAAPRSWVVEGETQLSQLAPVLGYPLCCNSPDFKSAVKL